jgi:uncharacterized protein
MKAAISRLGGPFALFGGEPLLVRDVDLEALWAWGFARFGRNYIQTNGTILSDNHLRMITAYNVHVGVSVDGPGALNDLRWHGTLKKTRAATARTELAIKRLCRAGAAPSLVVTLHQGNATEERLPMLCRWLRDVESLGIRDVRLHLLESENEMVRSAYALNVAENVRALRCLVELEEQLQTLRFDLFADMRRLLEGDDRSTACVWNACDPYNTQAVQGVEGQGEASNCGRTNKEGVGFGKSSTVSYERYLALYSTPQDAGGCEGCRFFLMCKGQCPGTAIDGDWRNRTEHCEVWKAMYADLEADCVANGREPLSLSSDRPKIEAAVIDQWHAGRPASMWQARAPVCPAKKLQMVDR